MKKLLLTTVLTTLLASIPAAHADPLDKSSPKIAEGMYREIDKSSPKIAHGMYRDRGKSSPKIAEGMRSNWEGGGGFNGMNKEIDKSSPKIAHGMYRDRGKSSPKIAHGMHTGRDNFDDELLYILENFRSGRGGR